MNSSHTDSRQWHCQCSIEYKSIINEQWHWHWHTNIHIHPCHVIININLTVNRNYLPTSWRNYIVYITKHNFLFYSRIDKCSQNTPTQNWSIQWSVHLNTLLPYTKIEHKMRILYSTEHFSINSLVNQLNSIWTNQTNWTEVDAEPELKQHYCK